MAQGMQIRSLSQLMSAANNQRYVIIPDRQKAFPSKVAASLIIERPARLVHNLIQAGMFLWEGE